MRALAPAQQYRGYLRLPRRADGGPDAGAGGGDGAAAGRNLRGVRPRPALCQRHERRAVPLPHRPGRRHVRFRAAVAGLRNPRRSR